MTPLNMQRLGICTPQGERVLRMISLALGLAVAVGLSVSVSIADAAFVSAGGNAEWVTSNPSDTQIDSFNTGNLAQTSVTGSASVSLNTSSGAAHADVAGTAAMGLLNGSASASASMPADSLSMPSGDSNGLYRFSDEITITSTTLAPGTAVDLLLTQRLITTMEGSGRPSGSVSYVLSGGVAPSPLVFSHGEGFTTDLCSGTCSALSTQTLHLSVGSSINITSDLNLFAAAVSTDAQGVSISSIMGISTARAFLFLDPLTPEASYITASGASYMSPVPVPAAALLFGSGLIGLLGSQWKRLRKMV